MKPGQTVLDRFLANQADSNASYDYTILELRNEVWYRWFMKKLEGAVDGAAIPVRVEAVK